MDSSMANRRRQAASVTGTEKPIITSPARRSNRRRAAVESAQCGESPCSENRAEGEKPAEPFVLGICTFQPSFGQCGSSACASR